ncbi:hypothetical protein [Arthrobacter caoxuetaonis]|uniref:Uncharacterized protein n=1 Tax=Arthrobacter caoxuetaonis TaxID=2886935 RepID=A0A9X1SDR8_9MICC|nr:hypothetical protein [Arthrobacter caoxuetaonis]MCC3299473.1 hypothetical protein [Arthrobacter caoxuetaonis]USQ59035.1 hypothetical protein NF551_18185 [Arthrobacter caoxuetaonis]
MITIPTAVPMASTVNLKGGWESFWTAITAGFPTITNMMTIVGVILVVFALLKWAWDRRRGGGMGQGAQPLWGALIPGAILAAPDMLFPILLGILDLVINVVISLINAATPG